MEALPLWRAEAVSMKKARRENDIGVRHTPPCYFTDAIKVSLIKILLEKAFVSLDSSRGAWNVEGSVCV